MEMRDDTGENGNTKRAKTRENAEIWRKKTEVSCLIEMRSVRLDYRVGYCCVEDGGF